MQTTCKLEGGGGQKSGKFANVVFECPLSYYETTFFELVLSSTLETSTDFIPKNLVNCDEGGKCESAIAKRLKRCVSEGFPDGGKSDLRWGSQLLHCTKARLMWGGDSKAACLPCICDYVQANMPDSAKWDDYTENFCSKHA